MSLPQTDHGDLTEVSMKNNETDERNNSIHVAIEPELLMIHFFRHSALIGQYFDYLFTTWCKAVWPEPSFALTSAPLCKIRSRMRPVSPKHTAC